MTDKTPSPGNAPGWSYDDKDTTPESVRKRVAAFCNRFDVTAPKIKTRKGEVVITDDLMKWFGDTGASIDWIFLGYPMPMAAKYRKDWLQLRDVTDAMSRLDPEESKMFVEAIEAWKAAIEARRERIEAGRAAAGEAA